MVRDFGPGVDVQPLATSRSVAYLVETPISHPATHDLFRIDGGTVIRETLPAGCHTVTASTPTALLAECGDGVASGSMGRRYLRGSTDSGHSWQPVHGPGKGSGYDDAGVADASAGNAVVATVGLVEGSLYTTGVSDGLCKEFGSTLGLETSEGSTA